MRSKSWQCIVFLLCGLGGAQAAPFTPSSDSEPLEQPPVSLRDPAWRELRTSQAALKTQPGNLGLALQIARFYLDLSRNSGDPRYIGYAQAALAPWWTSETPPQEVLLLRAGARQRAHLFDAALHDLDLAISVEPRNAQARFMRATVLQVTGAMEQARRECLALVGAAHDLARRACVSTIAAATGNAVGAYETLKNALEQASTADAPLRGWSMTTLAEIASRIDRPIDAERHFRDALAIAPDDAYLLGAYADFLLDRERAADVETLLAGKERIDPLLLRLALAAKSARSSVLAERTAQLKERFEASRLRGDAIHLREEARFALYLLGDRQQALHLATQNWRVQKEPADLRILTEAAVANDDRAALAVARDWLTKTDLQYAHVEKLLSATHPQ